MKILFPLILSALIISGCSGDSEESKFEQTMRDKYADTPWITRVSDFELAGSGLVAITTDLKAWQPNELTMALDACEAVVDTSANDVDVQVLGQYILREASVDINGDPVDADVGDGALIAQTGIDVDNPSADCRASD